MTRTSRTGLALRVQGLDPHDPHEPLDVLAVHKHAIALQPVPQAPGAQERVLGVEGIEPLHERQVVVGDRGFALVIHARSGHAKPRALARDRHHRMLTFDPLESLSRGPARALVQKNRSGP